MRAERLLYNYLVACCMERSYFTSRFATPNPSTPQKNTHPLSKLQTREVWYSSWVSSKHLLSSSLNLVKVLHSRRFLVGNVAEIVSIPSSCLVQNFTTEWSRLGTFLELMKRMSSSRMFVACSRSLSGTQGTLFPALVFVSFNVQLHL